MALRQPVASHRVTDLVMKSVDLIGADEMQDQQTPLGLETLRQVFQGGSLIAKVRKRLKAECQIKNRVGGWLVADVPLPKVGGDAFGSGVG